MIVEATSKVKEIKCRTVELRLNRDFFIRA